MSVLMGVPLGIRDQDIFTPLPNFPESPFQTKAAIIHVKLTKVFGQVVDSECIDFFFTCEIFYLHRASNLSRKPRFRI